MERYEGEGAATVEIKVRLQNKNPISNDRIYVLQDAVLDHFGFQEDFCLEPDMGWDDLGHIVVTIYGIMDNISYVEKRYPATRWEPEVCDMDCYPDTSLLKRGCNTLKIKGFKLREVWANVDEESFKPY